MGGFPPKKASSRVVLTKTSANTPKKKSEEVLKGGSWRGAAEAHGAVRAPPCRTGGKRVFLGQKK